ncbi:MAG: hypothetical protein IKL08_07100 [Clostridia bacterium]|nr:hypothetical protein [Clostridia bacterium]
MADNTVQNILNRLEIEDTGRYDNHFYIIDLEDSDNYAKMYTKLSKNAINTEYPTFGTNTSDSTVKITNYFEIEENFNTYRIFLIADFDNDKYYLKLGGFN